MGKQIKLINPRGFCSGVVRAISTVELALKKFGPPVYVRHQIVHNEYVIKDLEEKGAVFVETTADVPEGSFVIFSAHGAAPAAKKEAEERGLKIIDATCPLVNKVHEEAARFYAEGYKIILIGRAGHQEIIGVMGEAPAVLVQKIEDIDDLKISGDKIVCLAQTTLSADFEDKIIARLKKKFPALAVPSFRDVCQASRERQEAVKKAVREGAEAILIIGSPKSNNTNELKTIAREKGAAAFLISNVDDLKKEELENFKNIAVTSGASTPEKIVRMVFDRLKSYFSDAEIVEENAPKNAAVFSLPKEVKAEKVLFSRSAAERRGV